MTNKEAIEVLGEFYGRTNQLTKESNDAFLLAITALREKAEKERQFVVRADQSTRTYQVHENDGFYGIVAYYCKNVQQAQRIADIYEETYK